MRSTYIAALVLVRSGALLAMESFPLNGRDQQLLAESV